MFRKRHFELANKANLWNNRVGRNFGVSLEIGQKACWITLKTVYQNTASNTPQMNPNLINMSNPPVHQHYSVMGGSGMCVLPGPLPPHQYIMPQNGGNYYQIPNGPGQEIGYPQTGNNEIVSNPQGPVPEFVNIQIPNGNMHGQYNPQINQNQKPNMNYPANPFDKDEHTDKL